MGKMGSDWVDIRSLLLSRWQTHGELPLTEESVKLNPVVFWLLDGQPICMVGNTFFSLICF